MAMTLTLRSTIHTRRYNEWVYTAKPTNTSYTTGGDTVDLTAPVLVGLPAHAVPDHLPIDYEVSILRNINGTTAVFVVGTTLKNGKLQIFTTSNAEHAATAYSAGEQADEIVFSIRQNRGKSNG